MKKAISGNLDLQQAVMRVVEAATERGHRSRRRPAELGGTGSYTREQIGLRRVLLSQGVSGSESWPPGSPLKTSARVSAPASSAIGGALNKIEQPVNLYQYGLSSSWELDLFGRVRRSVEQAKAND